MPRLLLPLASLGTPEHHQGLRPFDWFVVGAYGITLILIGLYFARRQKTTEEYFLAGRSVGSFVAGLSLFASLVSTISFIATPGEMIQNGPVYVAAYIAAIPFTFVAAGWWLIPAIMRLRVTSAYELLETRLGRGVRTLASLTFVFTRLVWMALMLYTMSTVLISIMGWSLSVRAPISAVAGIVVVTYTLTGGMKALVVTDVLQFFLMLVGAVLTVVWISVRLHGVTPWLPDHWVAHWSPQPFFSTNPHVRVTVVGTFFGTLIWWVCAAGSDQLTIQRYLTTRDVPAARRAFLLTNLADITVSAVLGLVGLALLGYYRLRPADLPPELTFAHNGDELFPHFISHYLPIGISGLIVSAVIGATLSSLSSGLNSIITVITKDIVETFVPNPAREERTKMVHARILALGVGLVAVGASTVIGLVPGNLVEVANKTANLFGCPMFGLFFLAMFVPFATPFGAVFSALCSFIAAVVVAYWDRFTGQPGLSFQWIAPIALTVSVITGCGLSLLPTRGKSRLVVGGYSTAVLMLVVFGLGLVRNLKASEATAAPIPQLLHITWSKGVSLPQGFQDSDGGIIDDTLITVGGFCSGKQVGSNPETQPVPGKEGKYPRGFLKKVWGLNLKHPEQGWQELPDFPGVGRQELFAAVVGRTLYCWGGFNYTAPFCYADGYALSRASGAWKWEQVPALPWAVASAGICSIGTKIYVNGGAFSDHRALWTESSGGRGNARLGARLLVLDTAHLESGWSELPPCPGTPRMVQAVAAVGGKVYVIGGATGNDNPSAKYCTVVDNWQFDPANQKWTRLADTPIATGNFPGGAIVYRGRYLVLVGGFQYTDIMNPDGSLRPVYGQIHKHYPGNPYNSDVLVYDVLTNMFGTADLLPLCNNLPMTVVEGDELHLIGGETAGSVIEGERFGHHPELHLIGHLSVVPLARPN